MTQIADVMTRALVVVPSSAPVADAELLATERGIRHLLVQDQDQLVGVVCVCDLRGAEADARVRDCMSAPVRCVDPSASLEDAAEILRRGAIGCLPVRFGARVLGIVTRRDLGRAGFSEPLLSARICASCGAHHDVRRDPRTSVVWFCLECIDLARPPDDGEDLGEGD